MLALPRVSQHGKTAPCIVCVRPFSKFHASQGDLKVKRASKTKSHKQLFTFFPILFKSGQFPPTEWYSDMIYNEIELSILYLKLYKNLKQPAKSNRVSDSK